MTVRRNPRSWTAPCPVCARRIGTTGHGGHADDRGDVRPLDPVPVLYPHPGRGGLHCSGSWSRVLYPVLPPGASTWITWGMHADGCRTGAGLVCVCPLEVSA